MGTVKKAKEEVRSRGTLRTEHFLLYLGDLDSKSVIFQILFRKDHSGSLRYSCPLLKG